MNYYDISNPNAPFTTGYQKGLWQKTIVQIYRVLVMIGGILGICFIIGTGQREDYTMGMLGSCMLLLVSYLVFLIMLMYASIIISAKRQKNGIFRISTITIWLCTEPDIKIISDFRLLH